MVLPLFFHRGGWSQPNLLRVKPIAPQDLPLQPEPRALLLSDWAASFQTFTFAPSGLT